MKTAISVPNGVYEHVQSKSQELGMSRSQFFSEAAERYLRELEHDSLVSQVNEAVDLETALSTGESRQFVATGLASSQSRLAGEQW
jgi:predicted DNA-binding protein